MYIYICIVLRINSYNHDKQYPGRPSGVPLVWDLIYRWNGVLKNANWYIQNRDFKI